MSPFTYRVQAVRDVAWACFAPSLLDIGLVAGEGHSVASCSIILTPQRRLWLEQLDNNPQPLQAYLESKKCARLGLYFESLWQFFLQQDATIDLVAHNLAVRDQERTLGEFDIIYWCREREQHVHLELATKYFLGWRQQTELETASLCREWLGPNTKDRLDLKLGQLLQRQIRLGEYPQARRQLAARGVTSLAQEIAIKGYLFRSHRDPLPPPFGFNPQLALAQWLPVNALAQQLETLDTERFLLLPKLRWLSPAQLGAGDDIFSRCGLLKRLQSLLAVSPRAQLIAAIDNSGKESSRFFVTPNDWPASHQ
mgnify:CR=1 FL=1